jgi:hypothetical protein
MEVQTFIKNRKKLVILLLVCLLILGTIPFVEASDNLGWVVKANHQFNLINTDMNNIRESTQTAQKSAFAGNWQSDISKYADRMYLDSQAAINWSDSYNKVGPSYARAKEEFKIAMEQAAQAAVYINKGMEANITGNTEDEGAYSQKYTDSWNSYLLHKQNYYSLIGYIIKED